MNSPSNQKRVNVVWFIDTSTTHRFSVKLSTMMLSIFLLIFFPVALGVVVWYSGGLLRELNRSEDYIKELKTSVLAQAAIQQGLMSRDVLGRGDKMAALSSQEVEEVVAQIRENALQPDKVVDASPSSIAKPQAPLDSDKGNEPVESAQLSDGQVQETPAAKISSASSESEETKVTDRRLVSPDSVGISFSNFKLVPKGESSTLASFQLVSSRGASDSGFFGSVCLGVLAKSVAGAPDLLLSVPKSLVWLPSGHPTSCQGGQLVRFSKLRPTQVMISLKIEDIKQVTLYFSSSDEDWIASQRFTSKASPE